MISIGDNDKMMKIVITSSIVIGFQLIITIVQKQVKKQKGGLQYKYDLHFIRRLQHVSTGMVCLSLYSMLGIEEVRICLWGGLGALTIVLLLRKVSRWFDAFYLAQFSSILRPYEINQLPGAWYFLLGLSLSSYAGESILCLATVLVSVGDPAASVIGIYCDSKGYNKRLWEGKSLMGTVGGAGVVVLSTLLLFHIPYYSLIPLQSISTLSFLSLVFIISVCSELVPVSRKIYLDDNLVIPVVGSLLYKIYFNHLQLVL